MKKYIEKNGKNNTKVVSASHFLPRRDLLPTLSSIIKPTIPLVIGNTSIEKQIRDLNSKCHLFGHTHIFSNNVIDGVRYIQHPIAHPSDRKKWWNIVKTNEVIYPKIISSFRVQHLESGEDDVVLLPDPSLDENNEINNINIDDNNLSIVIDMDEDDQDVCDVDIKDDKEE